MTTQLITTYSIKTVLITSVLTHGRVHSFTRTATTFDKLHSLSFNQQLLPEAWYSRQEVGQGCQVHPNVFKDIVIVAVVGSDSWKVKCRSFFFPPAATH